MGEGPGRWMGEGGGHNEIHNARAEPRSSASVCLAIEGSSEMQHLCRLPLAVLGHV